MKLMGVDNMCIAAKTQTLQTRQIQNTAWLVKAERIFKPCVKLCLKAGLPIVIIMFFYAINCMAAKNDPSNVYYYIQQDGKEVVYYTNKPDSEMYSMVDTRPSGERSREETETAPEGKDSQESGEKNKKDITFNLIPPGFPTKQKIGASAVEDMNIFPSGTKARGNNKKNEDGIEKSGQTEATGGEKITDAIRKKIPEKIRKILSNIKPKNYSSKKSKQRRRSISLRDEIDQLIMKAANEYRLSPSLLKAIIRVESNFNPMVVSKKGAAGLMQIMPHNFPSLNIEDPFDVRQNIMGGANYLRRMLNYFESDLVKAIAAYNAGPGNVQKANGIPNIRETKQYVKKVLRYMTQYNDMLDVSVND